MTKYGNQMRSAIVTGGGPDPEANNKLANLIEQAKKHAGMSKAQIESILKGDAKKASAEHVVIEARGQGGYLIIIEVLTTNKVKSQSDLKRLLTKNG